MERNSLFCSFSCLNWVNMLSINKQNRLNVNCKIILIQNENNSLCTLAIFVFSVHHRIHVPTKVKTVYITKFIKIPEHHHYFHEKEKQIVVDHHDLHKDHDHELLFRGSDLGQHKNLFHPPRSHHSFKGYFY